MEEKIPKLMISWLKSFLEARKAKAKVNEEYSKWIKMKVLPFFKGLFARPFCSYFVSMTAIIINRKRWNTVASQMIYISGLAVKRRERGWKRLLIK